jgi:hypothetical protein
MDTCWLYPWAVLIGVWTEPGRGGGLLSGPAILALLLLAALSTHLLGRRARARTARLALAGLALLAAALAVRYEHYPNAAGLEWVVPLLGALAATIGQLTTPVLGFALALYVWWRGVRLGSQTPGFPEVESAFRWGIGRLAVFGLVMAVTTRASVLPSIESATTPYVVGFFFVSLLSLALGRLESLRTRTRRPSLNTQWLAVLVVVAAAIVLLALLLGQLVSFDVLLLATRPLFDLLGAVLLLLIYAIVIPLSYVIEWLIYLLLNLLQAGNGPPPAPPQPSDIDNVLQRFLAEQVSPQLLAGLKAAGAATLVGLALLVVARGLSRWRPSAADADATNEERDSVWSTQRGLALLLAWLRRAFGRGAKPALLAAAPVEAAASSVTPLGLASVRELYARLLKLGEAAGVRRAASTTPLEHEPALARSLEPDRLVTDLTDAYVRVRYAESAMPKAEVALLAEQLDGVQPKNAPQ